MAKLQAMEFIAFVLYYLLLLDFFSLRISLISHPY
jgi:hypothetical protein